MKNTVGYSLLLAAEALQLVVVLLAAPIGDTQAQVLPLSWYVASPLLLLPLLCVFLLVIRVPESKLVRKLYGTAKLFHCIGFVFYLYTTFARITENALVRVSVMHLAVVALMLVYSGILSAITLKSDGESCK